MMGVSLTKNINLNKGDGDPYKSLISEMSPSSYKSTNASFYKVVTIKQSPWIIESSGQTFDRDQQEELFFSKIATDEKQVEVISINQVDHLKETLGINISETAEILQITRQAIYDWKSGKAIPSAKNQERINNLIGICKKWESANLGQIRHLIRQNIWDNFSLFDLLCKDELDKKLIFNYFDKIKIYITSLNKERERDKQINEQYGFKQLSDKEKFEKLKKNSRKIG